MAVSVSRVPATGPPADTDRSARRGRDPAEIAILGGVALVSIWVLAWLVGRSISYGQVWTGIDGLHASDQLQYLAWIRAAGRSVLIANPYVLTPTPASFLHPGFLLSGLLFDIGLAPWLAHLLWKPVAVLALFLAVRAYARRLVPSTAGRRAALILALFFVSTAAFIGSVAGVGPEARLYLLGIEVDLWPGTWLWGYAFTALAVAAMPVALLLYERDRRANRIRPTAPAVGLLCSWFQPWQGATLLGVLLVTEAWCLRSELRPNRPAEAGVPGQPSVMRRLRLPLLNAVAWAAPLVYYVLLARYDSSWTLAGTVNRISAWPLWTLVVSIAPLAAPAVLAYRVKSLDFQNVALRVWPLVGLGFYWLIAYAHVGTFPLHAFQGLTIPLAVLAVIGVRSLRLGAPVARWAAVGAVAALTVPALVWKLNDAQRTTKADAVGFLGAPPNPYFLTHGEANALHYLATGSRPGGVLSSAGLGEVVPARTNRRVWVGLPSWTPNYVARAGKVEDFLSGAMSGQSAVRFVRSTGAQYVLLDCEHHANMAAILRPILVAVRQFGCATVLRVSRG